MIRPVLAVALALAAVGSAAANSPPAPPAPPALTFSAAECAVWDREASFARSAEQHDAAAFASHVHPGAVFFNGPYQAVRGRDAVAKEWAPIIEGKDIVLRWHPDAVSIGGDPDVALSRGPYWMENRAKDAPQPYLVGRFISTWVRGDDGQWRVLFDGGADGRPRPASAEDVERLKASAIRACPRA